MNKFLCVFTGQKSIYSSHVLKVITDKISNWLLNFMSESIITPWFLACLVPFDVMESRRALNFDLSFFGQNLSCLPSAGESITFDKCIY